jgi:hypothetical protein
MAKLAGDDAAGKNDAARLRKPLRRVLETLRPVDASLRSQSDAGLLVEAIDVANAGLQNLERAGRPEKPERPESLVEGSLVEAWLLVEVAHAVVEECAAYERFAYELSFHLARALKVRGIPPDPEIIAVAADAAFAYLGEVPLQHQEVCIPDAETFLGDVLRKYELVQAANTMLERAVADARRQPGQLAKPVRTGPLIQQVADVCYHLQCRVAPEPFYLSQRMLADALGCSQRAISTALWRLKFHKVLDPVSEDYAPGRRAKSYRFDFTTPHYTPPEADE